MYCGSKSIATRNGSTAHVYPLRCKRWTCPDCAPRRRRALIATAIEGQPNRFVTITCNPNWFGSPEERGEQLVRAWRDFVREERRLGNVKELQYLAVVELTAKGEPHIHLVCRSSRISQARLSNWMLKRIGAPIVDVRLIKGQKEVAKYVSKYISKRNIRLGSLKRYWKSLKYSPMTAKEKKALRKQSEAVWIIDMDRATYMSILAKNNRLIFKRFDDDCSFAMFAFETHPPGISTDFRRLH